jgi:intracellular sulfur oxidation DsrE/DsrF family protein
MNEEEKISEEMRGAFVDGQLDSADWARVAEAAERDPILREKTCDLRTLKEMVRHAYAAPPPRPKRARSSPGTVWRAIAAAALIAITAASGWFAHANWGIESSLDAASAYALSGDWHAVRSNWHTLDRNRILVHVSSDARLAAALDEVEDLLRAAHAEHRQIKVEIVANRTGIELLDAQASPYAGRIAVLRRQFPELRIVACGQTMERWRTEGKRFTLLPGAEVAPSALDEVVKRLRDGWVYVRA